MTKKPSHDTSLGGEGDRFPETTGDISSMLGQDGPTLGRPELELLCRRYWKPVYAYVRIAWAKSNEDAKDLAQAFFLWLMEGETLQRYDAERGGFRAYLKVLLNRFVGHEERALKRLKRGGNVHIVSIDEESASPRDLDRGSKESDPDAVFERVWLDQILQGALERVRERWTAEGRELRFKVYEALTDPVKSEQPSYKDLAARFDLKQSDIENYLFAIREAIRAEVRTALRQVTASPQEFEDEWKRLFGG
ncbi:MAG TPA: ECF-type sigma factor [Planctomycetota bacterium]|nr:ECF-type sigma factor [Planctomycetota bacterium]